jgi:hypothetical protein
MREIGAGHFGSKALGSLGMAGPTPRDPVALSRFSLQVCDSLRAFAPKKTKSRARGASFHANEWVERLDELRIALDGAIADVAREQREAIATQAAKDKAIEAYDEIFGRTTNLLSALLRYGGDEALAKRLRPSTRCPGQIAVEKPDEGGPLPAGTPPSPEA